MYSRRALQKKREQRKTVLSNKEDNLARLKAEYEANVALTEEAHSTEPQKLDEQA